MMVSRIIAVVVGVFLPALFVHAVVAQESLKLPDGVIHVKLPPGELRMEHIVRNGKPVVRLSVEKTVITAREIFLGDHTGATHFEAVMDGIHWAPASGKKGLMFGLGGASVRKPGSTIADPDFHALKKLKSGTVFVTTPSIKFVFGPKAGNRPTGREGPAKGKPNTEQGFHLADGVIHLAMPPGAVRMENIVRDGKPVLRLTVGKTVLETRTLFRGDGKGALQFEAIKQGMHWVPARGGKGFVINGTDTSEPGATLGAEEFITMNNLKAGSLYVTTPSINFVFGPKAKAKP